MTTMSDGADSLPVVVLGAGGHAKVLIDALLSAGRQVIGCTDPKGTAEAVLGIPVIGDDSALDGYGPRSVCLVNGMGSVERPIRRKELFERFQSAGYSFCRVVHPSAVVGREVVLGEGVQIMAGAVVQAGACLGQNVIVNTNASVDHDCIIGAHAHVAPGATLSGQVEVGECTHIGTGASVVQGIRIGKGVFVRAGALVIRDVEEGRDVAGVPCREIAS